jgi:hypothetical protein
MSQTWMARLCLLLALITGIRLLLCLLRRRLHSRNQGGVRRMSPSRGIYASRLLAFRTQILGAVRRCTEDMIMPRRMAMVLPAL